MKKYITITRICSTIINSESLILPAETLYVDGARLAIAIAVDEIFSF